MTYPAVDHTHDPALMSWVASARAHPVFPVQNLPLGVFTPPDGGGARLGAAIGDEILDLRAASNSGLLPAGLDHPLGQSTLNALFARPSAERRALRHVVSRCLAGEAHATVVQPMLWPQKECTLSLPTAIGDYTDFYVGIHHAENIGKLFRPDNPLLTNYKYVPIGYHGRASSVRPSGGTVIRPQGQRKAPDAQAPTFGPSRRLDYELELAVWIGPGNDLGVPIPIGEASGHIAGLGLLNDWSARDLQAWEYQPLGPFLAKNFHTTVSPWVVTVEALAPFMTAQAARPDGDPAPLPYLWDADDQRRGALAIELEVRLSTERMRGQGLAPVALSRGSARHMYWTLAQIVTHHASNGCNMTPGDLVGTGTISAPTRDGYGSLQELSRGGVEPIELPNGETRTFLEDGDEITLAGRAVADGFVPIGFGECVGWVGPSP